MVMIFKYILQGNDVLFDVEEIEKALAELNSSVALDCDILNVFYFKCSHPSCNFCCSTVVV